MAHIITVSNQKGGVGKTTSVVNIACYAALSGKKVLVVDCDPQGNASSVLAPPGAYESVFGGQEPVRCSQENLWVIPCGEDLLDQEKKLVTKEGGRFALKQRLEALAPNFDLIFLDCPPSLAALSVNALVAGTKLLIPIQCEYFAMEGLSQLLANVGHIQDEADRELPLLGLLLTMCDFGPFAQQVATEIRRHFPDRVLNAVIPRDTALAAAPSHGKTILEYDPLSSGSLAYLEATREILNGLQ
jgi:chromosome partitioning protein